MPHCVHATKSGLLEFIIGIDCPGLLLGGYNRHGTEYEGRGHIHCASSLPAHGEVPAGFRKQGVDCMICLDAEAMLYDGIPIFESATGVILIPQQVDAHYVKWVQLLRMPMLTIYKKAAAHAVRSSPKPFVTCVNCLSEWPLGMWLCLSC